MSAHKRDDQVRCPACGEALVCIDTPADFEEPPGAWHRYVCPSGCTDQQADGTFHVTLCPSCGSPDTTTTPGDGLPDELECHACGTITILDSPTAAWR